MSFGHNTHDSILFIGDSCIKMDRIHIRITLMFSVLVPAIMKAVLIKGSSSPPVTALMHARVFKRHLCGYNLTGKPPLNFKLHFLFL